jgi:tetratricopeptide (TPR) repeat protein
MVPPRVSFREKALLAVFGVVLALVLGEVALRAAGYAISEGQRQRNAAAETDTGAYRILALGESTTASYFAEGKANDWPAQLQRILNERSYGRRFVVFNEGVGGTTSAFILAALRDNLDRYRPDMVVTMMGANDHEMKVRFDDSFPTRASLFFYHLRLVKLARQAFAAVRGSPVSSARRARREQPPVSAKHLADEAFVGEIAKALDAFGEGRVAEGEHIFHDALTRHPDNSIFYAELGRMYQNTRHEPEAVAALARAHQLDPTDVNVLSNLGVAYALTAQWQDCVTTLEKWLDLCPDPDKDPSAARVINRLTECKQRLGEPTDSVQSLASSPAPTAENTGYHYQKLQQMLAARGIRYVAMQYPTRPVQELKNFLGDARRDVVFVENRRRFEESCSGPRYDACFSDRFAGDFGHTTAFGHRLIAEAAAEVILGALPPVP